MILIIIKVKKIKNVKKLVFFLLSTALTGCVTGDKSIEEVDSTASLQHHAHLPGEDHIFACPMHIEVTGKEGESCSKCGMQLEHNDNAGKQSNDSFYMEFSTSPAIIEAGKEAALYFNPKIKGREKELVPLEIHHEKKIHLIIVSEDLSYFDHIHPEYKANGDYEIKVLAKDKPYTDKKGQNETKFETAGNYILFADFKPSIGNHTVDKIFLKVNGNALSPKKFDKEKLSGTSGDYTVSLIPDGGKLVTGALMNIDVLLKSNSKIIDASALENYLGAKAHMVMISTNEKNYLHIHPNIVNGRFKLNTTFEKAGTYRGWLQFKADDTLHTIDFVIMVNEANAEK